ncbi:MAG: aminotransferase class IV [Cyclobacteriaceae bacterium]|nr:aminotransferase class IV [Cyclobacteriaceae bacterium]
MSEIDFPKAGLYKVRVVYNREVLNIDFTPYVPREVRSLRLIEMDIDYSHKFENREMLTEALKKRADCDEIIIVNDGFITDSSIANLIFKKEDQWYTPDTFLLAGTMRACLLETGQLKTRKIHVEDLSQYQSCKLINAMIGKEGPEIPMNAIR